jgi:hypothetical protein
MTRLAVFACWLSAVTLTGCTTWHVRPGTVAQALPPEQVRDIAVRFQEDSTRWYKIEQARVVGDTILGWSRKTGTLRRVALPVADVLGVAVREPNRAAIEALTPIAWFGLLVGFLGAAGAAFIR